MPITISIVKRLIKLELSVYLQQYISPLFSTIIMVIAIFSLKHLLGNSVSNPIILLAICIPLAVVIYSSLIMLIAPKLYREIISIGSKSLAGKFNV